jgi:cyclopropane fatty-acyl-phospholipid synthase-like methyltransferase
MTAPPDVESPIDLRKVEDARRWAAEATAKRPYRAQLFETIADRLASAGASGVLELGSGPGELAEVIVRRLPDVRLTLLDFSVAMHDLARDRLQEPAERVRYLVRDLRAPDWPEALGTFDAVVSMQAVHELRHKRHAPRLHGKVLNVLESGGMYLVCDHFAGEGGISNSELFMNRREQSATLKAAGFTSVRALQTRGTLQLIEAMKGSAP